MADHAVNHEKFAAFVSYSHNDARWAQWLHRRIETYKLPRQLAGADGRRSVGRLFLDRSELATSSDLSSRIQDAMDRSDNLLVVCSPAARASRWVNEEVKRFREAGKGNRIFCLIVDGDPTSSDERGCFPDALVAPDQVGAAPLEPLAADVRPGKDRPNDAKLKLIAGLLDLPFDALKRREQVRRQRLLALTAGVSLALLAVMTVLTISAVLSRREAVRQRDTADRTATFLRDLFDGARPDSATGREVTVREMVDHAATDAVQSPELRREPEVRASLLTTLADVYAKLHLPAAGRTLITEARRYPVEDKRTIAYRALVDANLRGISGDYAGLRPTLQQALEAVADDDALERAFEVPLLMQRAKLAESEQKVDEAERDYREVRRRALAADPPEREHAATALLAAALIDVDRGQVDRGEQRLRQSLAEYQAMGRPLDPDVLTAYNTLGAIAIKRGDPKLAEQRFRHALARQLRVYGPSSLDVALTRSNLGRALVEQRRFAEAKATLEVARPVYLREVGARADVLANLDDSFGLALAGLNQATAAEAAYASGLAAARANEMPKEVELLTDLAELRCAGGKSDEATALIAEARRALTRFALTEPWRSARIDNVAGFCLLRAGRGGEAAPLLARSTPIVIARWGRDSLFGAAARERLRRVSR